MLSLDHLNPCKCPGDPHDEVGEGVEGKTEIVQFCGSGKHRLSEELITA